MEKDPLVSIIINNYNYGRFLKEAIDSALAQTYKNIEVIVVDDGSTDNSLEIISKYGDKIIPVLKENGGQGSAYNAGFLKSKGKFICNLDADDSLLQEAIEVAMINFKDDEVVKVQWPLFVVDKYGKATGEISTKWIPPEGDLKEFILENGPFYDFYLTTGCLLKRHFLEKVFPMIESPYRNGADVYLITLAPLFGKIKNVAKPLSTYRSHGKNNYRNRTLDDSTIKNYVARFETNCEALFKYCSLLGLKGNPELWKLNNFNYLWPKRLLLAKKDIELYVPEDNKYILVNNDEWGKGQPIPNRHAIPFTERDGKYAGPPDDDETAIKELERLRKKGANFIFFWYTSFWWLEHYTTFHYYLNTNFRKLLENERLVIFDLRNSITN